MDVNEKFLTNIVEFIMIFRINIQDPTLSPINIVVAKPDMRSEELKPPVSIQVPPPTVEINDFEKPYWNSDQNAAPISKTIVSSPPKKISRDSLIHKNDIFTFDDVESIHTHYTPIRNIHNFSLESTSTFDSSDMTGSNSKKKSNESGFLKSLINPILRGVNGSNSSSGISSKKENVIQKPQSISSFNKQNESNLDKPIQAAAASAAASAAAIVADSVTSLERKNTFSNRLSSLKKMIVSKHDLSGSKKNLNKETDQADNILKPKVTIQTSNSYLSANLKSEIKRNSETNIQESRSNASANLPSEIKRKAIQNVVETTTVEKPKSTNKKFFKAKVK